MMHSQRKLHTYLYTLREMVLPKDELKIFNEMLEIRLEATQKQLNEWLLRWRPVIDLSMKKVKEMAQTRSIWRHFTADKPAKTKVTRQVSTRKHVQPVLEVLDQCIDDRFGDVPT